MVFLTGGTGLVGMRLLYDLLSSGVDVRALRRPSSDLELVDRVFEFYKSSGQSELKGEVEWVEGDVLEVDSLRHGIEGCNRVYHAAAMVSFHPRDRRLMDEVNVRGTANVVDTSLDMGVGRLCHISSVASFGRTGHEGTITEATPWSQDENTSAYSISKYRAELEVWRGSEEGLPATIVNPSLILGPTDKMDSSGQLFLTAMNGLRFHTPGLGSYVDVKDVSSFAIELMSKGGKTERFILSSETWPSKRFFSILCQEFGKKTPHIGLGRLTGELAWRVFWIKDLVTRSRSPITKETVRSSFTRFTYDSSKVIDRLDRSFLPVQDSLLSYVPFYSQ